MAETDSKLPVVTPLTTAELRVKPVFPSALWPLRQLPDLIASFPSLLSLLLENLTRLDYSTNRLILLFLVFFI